MMANQADAVDHCDGGCARDHLAPRSLTSQAQPPSNPVLRLARRARYQQTPESAQSGARHPYRSSGSHRYAATGVCGGHGQKIRQRRIPTHPSHKRTQTAVMFGRLKSGCRPNGTGDTDAEASPMRRAETLSVAGAAQTAQSTGIEDQRRELVQVIRFHVPGALAATHHAAAFGGA